MKIKKYKRIRRNIIIIGNYIILILLLLNIKNNTYNNINIYRYNLLLMILSSILYILNIFIIKLKNI